MRLATLLRHVGCWLKFENGQTFHETFVDVAWCCTSSRLARFVQQCCAWACTLVRFSTRNMSQHVATEWLNACNMLRSTILLSVSFKCCDRLAGACKCWANNIRLCFIEMLRSFGRGLNDPTMETIIKQMGSLQHCKTVRIREEEDIRSVNAAQSCSHT